MLGILVGMDQKDSHVVCLKVTYIPVVAQRLIPMVQTVCRTKEIHQLHVNKAIDVPGVQVVRVTQVDIIPVATQRLSPWSL